MKQRYGSVKFFTLAVSASLAFVTAWPVGVWAQERRQNEAMSVRVLNAKDGAAEKNLPLWIYPVEAEKPTGKPLVVRTGTDGVAVVHIPKNWPSKIFIVSEISGRVRACSGGLFSLEAVRNGAIAQPQDQYCPSATRLLNKLHTQSNELILFVRHLNRWEQMQK